MSNPFATEFDAIAFDAFESDGIGDLAVYQAPSGSPITGVRVLVNRGVQIVGENMAVLAPQTTISILRDDVAAPVRGATVTIGSEVFTLDQATDNQDEARSTWMVTT